MLHFNLGNDGIILISVVGSEYEFIFADGGMNGRMSDDGNWARVSLVQHLNTLKILYQYEILNHYLARGLLYHMCVLVMTLSL